jgi:hypothetical protein
MAGAALVNYGPNPIGVQSYHYTSDDTTPVDVTIEVGFYPSLIQVINLATPEQHIWTKGMPLTSSLQIAAAGTQTIETDNVTITAGVAESGDGSGTNVTFTLEAAAQTADDTFTITIYP